MEATESFGMTLKLGRCDLIQNQRAGGWGSAEHGCISILLAFGECS